VGGGSAKTEEAVKRGGVEWKKATVGRRHFRGSRGGAWGSGGAMGAVAGTAE